MIKRKTVLVLGAGASMPYGFPSGTALRNAIRALEGIDKQDPRLALYDKCGASLEDLRGLGRAVLNSGTRSIDVFLERHPHLIKTSKLVIAREICGKENRKELIGQFNDHWYEYLWHYMLDDVTQPDHLAFNQIRFLTFNYDRSLEYFLYNATKHAFGVVDDDRAVAATLRIQTLHIYGAVGNFHYVDSNNARAYSPDLNAAKLRLAADGIRIIPDAAKSDQAFQEARKWFDWADDICFLGFGFDETNCERLGLNDVIQTRAEQKRDLPRIYASVVGRTPVDIDIAREIICPTVNWMTLQHPNLLALQHTTLFRQ